ncbi:helix-turn-helix domain-containing protein [Clostridium botulinum]|nr:helix-turn-helix domain-containing protein [Clostridium botulinum]MCS4467610.1 helix-turn-helix domain-containing protein [Clostridium botulinum]MCS4516648.1 helix-turn-helix domain-containing protein [Clostridium botulinum]MCS4525701.1 helix-turn-helix domain-containing protein [Clostridium botulinum]
MLADEIGKSRSYICDIERGRTYPSFATLSAIARACDVPLDFFKVIMTLTRCLINL